MITKLSSLNDIANEFGVPPNYRQKHFLLLQQQKSTNTEKSVTVVTLLLFELNSKLTCV